MQKPLSTLLFSCFLSIGSVVAAEQSSGYYLSGSVGASVDVDGGSFDILGVTNGVDVELQFGPSATIALGYSYGNGWRTEASLSHTRADVGLLGLSVGAVELGEVRANSMMVTGYYDFRQGSRLQPYVGLGLGLIQSKYSGTSLSLGGGLQDFTDDDLSPGAQIVFGLGYWLTDRLMLTGEYRYVSTLNDAKYGLSNGNIVTERFDLHRVMMGLRYTF